MPGGLVTEKIDPIRPTDDKALHLARILLRGSRYGALAVLDPETGFPLASRTLIGADVDGFPVMLVSELASHTGALLADPRCSLLVGEPAKGDPLAWPRMTVAARAQRLEKGTFEHNVIRSRFLRRHPKSKLYADFPDFMFFKIWPECASLNGGFGKAYKISRNELYISSTLNAEIAKDELHILARVASLSPDAANLLANKFSAEKSYNWEFTALDAAGIELAHNEHILRIELDRVAEDIKGLIVEYENMLMEIP